MLEVVEKKVGYATTVFGGWISSMITPELLEFNIILNFTSFDQGDDLINGIILLL